MEQFEQFEHNKKAFLEALEMCHGIVTNACKATKLSRTNVYNWLKDDPNFKEAFDEINEASIDYVESKLFERIEGVNISAGQDDGEQIVYKTPPSDTAIIFYLKTKGKKRGYVEKTEQAITVNQPMIVEWGNPNEDTAEQKTE